MDTWIYLIKDNRTGYYKIGKSNDPQKRLRKLKQQPTLLPLPHDFELVHAWEEEATKEFELHARYANKRVRGEWFCLSRWDVLDMARHLDEKGEDVIKRFNEIVK